MMSPNGSPTASRDEPSEWTPYETRFGTGWVGCDSSGRVARLALPATADPAPVRSDEVAARRLVRQLEAYFAGTGSIPDAAPFIEAAAATELDRDIYRVVVAIPTGSTMTYTEVASRAGRPGAARAVGAAMARNRFAPIIPCHRVVGSDGSLRGYSGGLPLKRALLDMEAADA